MFVQWNFRQIRLHFGGERNLFLDRSRRDRSNDAPDQAAQRRRFQMNGQFACFKACGVQQIIDANAQLITALPGDAEIFQLPAV